MQCPEFDKSNFEDILTWADAKVYWNDMFIDGEGTVSKIPELACWILKWKNGTISFLHLTEEKDEHKAHINAALFIYLWSRGVDAAIADNCSSSYVMALK